MSTEPETKWHSSASQGPASQAAEQAGGNDLESADAQLADLIEEMTAAREAGEPVDVETYAARHPDQAALLRKLWPTIVALDGLAQSTDATVTGGMTSHDLGDEFLGGLLGDFRLLRVIGRGGMGVVYEAEQVSLGRRVAIKTLPDNAFLEPRQLQRFKNEARAAAVLEHPHIVPLYDFWRDPEGAFLVNFSGWARAWI